MISSCRLTDSCFSSRSSSAPPRLLTLFVPFHHWSHSHTTIRLSFSHLHTYFPWFNAWNPSLGTKMNKMSHDVIPFSDPSIESHNRQTDRTGWCLTSLLNFISSICIVLSHPFFPYGKFRNQIDVFLLTHSFPSSEVRILRWTWLSGLGLGSDSAVVSTHVC